MIDVKCDGCKKPISELRKKVNTKDFTQVLGDNGKVEADLCNVCYKRWCEGLNSIDKEFEDLKDKAEKHFKHKFLTSK